VRSDLRPVPVRWWSARVAGPGQRAEHFRGRLAVRADDHAVSTSASTCSEHASSPGAVRRCRS
jgi:hypothetical protein